jgi:hypothetical protein
LFNHAPGVEVATALLGGGDTPLLTDSAAAAVVAVVAGVAIVLLVVFDKEGKVTEDGVAAYHQGLW